jgi:hypothetical protein
MWGKQPILLDVVCVLWLDMLGYLLSKHPEIYDWPVVVFSCKPFHVWNLGNRPFDPGHHATTTSRQVVQDFFPPTIPAGCLIFGGQGGTTT